ncbi:MAG: hypothetical protein IPK34_00905 [Ramlibacter sp.]|nr:hypothetical protein [Ramlibacter sp.]
MCFVIALALRLSVALALDALFFLYPASVLLALRDISLVADDAATGASSGGDFGVAAAVVLDRPPFRLALGFTQSLLREACFLCPALAFHLCLLAALGLLALALRDGLTLLAIPFLRLAQILLTLAAFQFSPLLVGLLLLLLLGGEIDLSNIGPD